jgi:hypothetical protein
LVHDFGNSFGTIVFRLVLPSSDPVPGTAALTVTMSSLNER